MRRSHRYTVVGSDDIAGAPVLGLQSAASSTSRAGTRLRPARPSGIFSSGECSQTRSHKSSLERSATAIAGTHNRRANDLETGSGISRSHPFQTPAVARAVVPLRAADTLPAVRVLSETATTSMRSGQ